MSVNQHWRTMSGVSHIGKHNSPWLIGVACLRFVLRPHARHTAANNAVPDKQHTFHNQPASANHHQGPTNQDSKPPSTVHTLTQIDWQTVWRFCWLTGWLAGQLTDLTTALATDLTDCLLACPRVCLSVGLPTSCWPTAGGSLTD